MRRADSNERAQGCEEAEMNHYATIRAALDVYGIDPDKRREALSALAELEEAVTIRDTEIARLETDLELARRDAARWEPGHRRYWYTRMLNPTEFERLWIRSMTSGMSFDELVEAKIDKEREARSEDGGGK